MKPPEEKNNPENEPETDSDVESVGGKKRKKEDSKKRRKKKKKQDKDEDEEEPETPEGDEGVVEEEGSSSAIAPAVLRQNANRIVKEGYLFKKSKKLLTPWRKVWVRVNCK